MINIVPGLDNKPSSVNSLTLKMILKSSLLKDVYHREKRRKAIQDDLSLANILAYARSLEITEQAVKTLEFEEDCGHLAFSSSAVNAIDHTVIYHVCIFIPSITM